MTRGKVVQKIPAKIVDKARPWLDYRFFTFLQALFAIESIRDTSDFLNAFFSNYERQAILQRWHIILYLQKTKLSYEEIAAKLGCSTKTITRIARRYKSSPVVADALEAISPNKLTEKELGEKAKHNTHKAFLKRLKGGGFWARFLGEYQRTAKNDLVEKLISKHSDTDLQ